jgi:RimJ/RimL family protein N-acetyltransferase
MNGFSLDELLTERLRLVRPTSADFDALFNMHNDPRMRATLGPPRTADEGRQYMNRHLDHWDRHGWGWWIARDRSTNAFLGRGGLRQMTVNGRDEVELGYGFIPEAWGRGFATELARETVRIAFDVLHLPSLISMTLPTNGASRRVLEKVGFVFERDGYWADLPHVFFRLMAPHSGTPLDCR